MFKSKYSPEQKAEFVAKVLANSGNVEKTSREINVPYSTLKRVYDQTPSPVANKLLEVQKSKFVLGCWDIIKRATSELNRNLKDCPPERIRALTVLITSLYDKQEEASFEPQTREKVYSSLSSHSKKIFLEFEQSKTEKVTLVEKEPAKKSKKGRRSRKTGRKRPVTIDLPDEANDDAVEYAETEEEFPEAATG